MKRTLFTFCMVALFALAAGTAMADSIKGRLGITGKVGFINPTDSEINGSNIDTDIGIIGGGGFIYGVTDHIAAELDITHASFGSKQDVDFDTTNISLGVQYRFIELPISQLVPYAGGGLDILLNDAGGARGAVSADDVLGVHLNGGIDYFLQRQLAANVELKAVLAPDADINNASGNKIGEYDPMSFSMTFGLRYFFY